MSNKVAAETGPGASKSNLPAIIGGVVLALAALI